MASNRSPKNTIAFLSQYLLVWKRLRHKGKNVLQDSLQELAGHFSHLQEYLRGVTEMSQVLQDGGPKIIHLCFYAFSTQGQILCASYRTLSKIFVLSRVSVLDINTLVLENHARCLRKWKSDTKWDKPALM